MTVRIYIYAEEKGYIYLHRVHIGTKRFICHRHKDPRLYVTGKDRKVIP